MRDFAPDDDDSSYRYTDRDEDMRAALEVIEEALATLACMGPGDNIDKLQELLNRAIQLLDRHYSSESEYVVEVELDFDLDEDEDQDARWN